jgi:hypothetical protein
LPVQHIHAYLVHPKKGEKDRSQRPGTDVPFSGQMFDLMDTIYSKSESDCDIDITFRSRPDGKQQNDCRDLLLAYLAAPSLITGQTIAERLGETTDLRSALGLLFLIVGKEGKDHTLVISRFPTDSAIYVEEKPRALTVQFLERVFMKNKHSYKAVRYRGTSLSAHFWNGHAIDKQINTPTSPTSNYWIANFLLSEFTVTSAHGTQRFAKALRVAVQSDIPVQVKQEIIAAATLSSGLGGQKMSINQIAARFNLSQPAQAAIIMSLKKPALANEMFSFDAAEFKAVVAFRSVELDNGATLTAESDRFDTVFRKENIKDETQYITRGRVVNEKFKIKA